MAVYKVPQDVEAEDKLIGPLTFKKAILAGVMLMLLGLAWVLLRIPPRPFWSLIPLPFAAAFGILAFYPSKDQPVEIILAAKIRFALKPRRRIWDQRGVKQLVTITVPRRIERHLTKGYSEGEVSSRLLALAKTLDSRGWAVKNVSLNTFSQPAYASGPSDQRLISPSILPQTMQAPVDVQAADDILDHTSNPTAQHFDQMMNRAAETQRQTAIDRMHQASDEPAAYRAPGQPYIERPGPPPAAMAQEHVEPSAYSMQEPVEPPAARIEIRHPGTRHAVGNPTNAGFATFGATTLQAPDDDDSYQQQPEAPSQEEAEFLAKVRKQQGATNHHSSNMKRIKTPKEIENEEKQEKEHKRKSEAAKNARATGEEKSRAAKSKKHDADQAAQTSPDPSNPAILELANNDDLNIATLARQAKVATDKLDDGEVVISLR